jgi:hypothetical protein
LQLQKLLVQKCAVQVSAQEGAAHKSFQANSTQGWWQAHSSAPSPRISHAGGSSDHKLPLARELWALTACEHCRGALLFIRPFAVHPDVVGGAGAAFTRFLCDSEIMRCSAILRFMLGPLAPAALHQQRSVIQMVLSNIGACCAANCLR